jgi:hypothetical protein
MKYADYINQTVNARYTIERNIDGADVPVIREGEITIRRDAAGDIALDVDGDYLYPFDDTFELL